MKKLKACVCAVTHAGRVRTDNEDNFVLNGKSTSSGELKKGSAYVQNMYEPFYFGVCDGMGGESMGELASGIACDSLVSYAKQVLDNSDDFGAPLAACLRDANQKICDEISKNGTRIGTTLAGVYIAKGKLICVNVGDSRVYRYSNGILEQMSVDHTHGQSVVDAGEASADKARNIPNATKLTRHLGIFPDEAPLSPSVCVMDDIETGDVILVCSDGLTDLVSDSEITSILSACENSQEASSRLVRAALANGGKDNITVISAYMKAEQGAIFAPIAQAVVGDKDADYSEEYMSNYGKEADRNAAIAALKETEEDDKEETGAKTKKLAFMALVVVVGAALIVLLAFGIKALIERSGENNTTTTLPVISSTTTTTTTAPSTEESTTVDVSETESESSTEEEETTRTTTSTTKKRTTTTTTKKKTTTTTTTKTTTTTTTQNSGEGSGNSGEGSGNSGEGSGNSGEGSGNSGEGSGSSERQTVVMGDKNYYVGENGEYIPVN